MSEESTSLWANRYSKTKIVESKFEIVPIIKTFDVINPPIKIKSKSFLKNGKFPIIDQSSKFIAGYWNEPNDRMIIDNPLIIFGDHTKNVKFINFDFVAGADGIKILAPKENINPKYLFFILKYLKLPNLGYSRHFSEVKLKEIPLPSISTQNKIVDELDNYQKIVDGCNEVIKNYTTKISFDPLWDIIELGEVCSLITGGTPTSTKREYYDEGDVPWLVSGDIHQGQIFKCKGRITQKGLESSNAKLLPINSVIIALNGKGKTRGTVAMLRMEATCNQSLVSILPNDHNILLADYVYICLSSMYKEIREITGDNERSGLNMPLIKKIKIPLAPIDIQKKLIENITEERKLIQGNHDLIKIYSEKMKNMIENIWIQKN